ncbi:MAG TPA: PBP1A family penicillin-binding protein [Pyrinomonadaceae bacterium]|jgi:penicillin-binding protein 1B|nr:PBP1A family penicillin-binding protein [Pyrinomonadaceae bacterium]
MAIEVTSIPDSTRLPSLRKFASNLASLFHDDPLSNRRRLLRSLFGLLLLALIVGGDMLLSSYRYYSRVIDARLASGYLTSRPGLYAAPRSLQVGQKLSRAGLIVALKRAGYVQSEGSNVWSGSFRESATDVEIRPNANQARAAIVKVTFTDDKTISALTDDDIAIDSFTLEPEVLSNDPLTKAGKREAVRFSEIPPVLVHAILSTEDHRFFQHPGVDVFGIARALLHNAGEDRMGQGGSTITQQLVKNTYLTPERTLRRKYAEAMLAYSLERRLSKEDIFALYCNEVYLGQRGAVAVRGVEEATRIYFGKELKDLSLGEAAMIAGMIQGPMRYSPTQHAEIAQQRRNVVLEAMTRDGWIAAGEASATSSEPVVVAASSHSDNSLAPYFVDYVNRAADSQSDASAAHQRIYTTIDLDLQQLAEAALKQQLDRLDALRKDQAERPQAALVALDPKTGNVLAMVGGRDYAVSQLNRATDARRQPGSTFKPFVYAAAIEDGMSPVQMFDDAPHDFVYDRNKIYRPANFGGGYSMHDVTMRTGLVKSLNVVTVDIALQTGLARIANLAERFGLPKPERYPSLALGTKEVTPLELAAAYAAFVNGGHRVQPKVVLSVGEPPAKHVANDAGPETQVISPTTSYMITNMLAAVIDHGTARSARDAVRGTATAGKTGTSRDGWFVGYTPNLVCAIWIGYDDNKQLGLTGAEAALPAWSEFMKAAVDLEPDLGGRNFDCPEGIKFVEIDADNGALSTLSCPHRELIAVTERLAPNVDCLLHGNLPDLSGIGEGNVAESDRGSEQLLTQHSRSTGRVLEFRPLLTRNQTRVDMDLRGKKTLVNDMR